MSNTAEVENIRFTRNWYPTMSEIFYARKFKKKHKGSHEIRTFLIKIQKRYPDKQFRRRSFLIIAFSSTFDSGFDVVPVFGWLHKYEDKQLS